MRSQSNETHPSFPHLLKYCAGVFCFFVSMLVVACSSNSGQYILATPQATLTISLGQHIASPTPTLLPYYCGGWATETTPAYNAKGVVTVYGKFTRTVLGNPIGVANAAATATVFWPDGSTNTEAVTTTSDGLAVFTIPLRPSALNHIVQIQMTFTSTDGVTCHIPRPAYFAAILVSPTPSASPAPGCHRKRCPTPTVSPIPTKKPGR